jgi:hypothetical protein
MCGLPVPQVVQALLSRGVPAGSIGVIAFYRAQVRQIQSQIIKVIPPLCVPFRTATKHVGGGGEEEEGGGEDEGGEAEEEDGAVQVAIPADATCCFWLSLL